MTRITIRVQFSMGATIIRIGHWGIMMPSYVKESREIALAIIRAPVFRFDLLEGFWTLDDLGFGGLRR